MNVPGISLIGTMTMNVSIVVKRINVNTYTKNAVVIEYQSGNEVKTIELREGEMLTVSHPINGTPNPAITLKDALRVIKQELE